MNDGKWRSTKRILITTAISAVGAAINAFESAHSSKPDAPLWAKFWFALCVVSVLVGVGRLAYYRNRRDYFTEEMDHRKSLAKGSLRVKS